MKTIWKFDVSESPPEPIPGFAYGGKAFTIYMPIGAEIACLQKQHGKPKLWAIVDNLNPLEEREFYIIGTGQNIPQDKPALYIGSWAAMDDNMVWHLFEVLK